ncbi:MAG TPA: hypothetical protein VFM93_11670 [Candidatus Limnocylindria bacterium]|nr:hypothetical protein [Candidatus Limnocylindria bacterium]
MSDDEVKRIARATADETLKRVLDLVLITAVSLAALAVFPMLIVMAVSSFAPPPGLTANPLMGAFFVFTFAVLAMVVVRSWSSLRRR